MAYFPKVAIVVLNYNGERCLEACLRSLEELLYEKKEIIVVDNNSTDRAFFTARTLFPQVVFVSNTSNEGFARGANKGIRLALERGAEWVWLFNNDATADPAALSALVAVAEENPNAGLLSPVISETGGGIWFAKGKIDFLRMRSRHVPMTRAKLPSRPYQSEFLTGCALFVRKELVDVIGFLDERFFLYYEDADYSLRARVAGFSLLVVPAASVFHHEASRQNPQKTYFLVLSGLLFFEKHASFLLRAYHRVYVTMRRAKNLIDRARAKSPDALETYRAYQEYLYGRPLS